MSHEVDQVLVVPPGFESFVAEGDFLGIGSECVEGEASQDGKIGRCVVVAASGEIFGKQDVELPMELVFDGPVATHRVEQLLGRHLARQGIAAQRVAGLAVDRAPALDPGDGDQVDQRVLAGGLGKGMTKARRTSCRPWAWSSV